MACKIYVPGKGYTGALNLEECEGVAVPTPINLFDASTRRRSLECIVARLAAYGPAAKPAQTIVVGGSNPPLYIGFHELIAERATSVRKLLDECVGKPKPLVYIYMGLSRAELLNTYSKHGSTPIQLLEKMGMLTPCTVLVNPFWVTSWEMELLSEAGSVVVISVSDSILAGSIPLFHELARHGVVFSIATGFNGQSVVDEVRLASLLTRGLHGYDDTEHVFQNVFSLNVFGKPQGYLVLENNDENPWRVLESLGSLAVKKLVCF